MLRCLLSVALVFVAIAYAAAEPTNPFFAMDTGTRDARHPGPKEQAQLLKGLGYAGIGGSGYDQSAWLKELESRGLKLFNVYLTITLDDTNPAVAEPMQKLLTQLEGHDSALWLAVSKVSQSRKTFGKSEEAGDAIAVKRLQEIAEAAQKHGVKVALYPHTGFWLERVDDAIRVAEKVDRPILGSTFNLCHWLKVEGDRDPQPALAKALPKLMFVTINGADSGETKSLGWNKLIQTLDQGTYDQAKFLATLREVGYRGPIGLQGYGIGGEVRTNLTRSMEAWKKIK